MLKSVKSLTLEDVLSKLVYSNVSQTGGLGAEPPKSPVAMGVWGQSPQPLGDFCKFLEKKSYLNPIGSHFARVQSHFKELDFKQFKANRKNLVVQSSFCNQIPKHA